MEKWENNVGIMGGCMKATYKDASGWLGLRGFYYAILW